MIPIRPVPLADYSARVEKRPDGTCYLRNRLALGDYPRCLTERLVHWASHAPQRVFLADRGPDGDWREVTYAQALEAARALGQALLDHGLSAERPLAILSGNDIEHGLLALAALHVGVPFAPLSPGYSLLSRDFGKLRHILGLLTPGMIYMADGVDYARAFDVLPEDATWVFGRRLPGDRAAASFASLMATTPTGAVDAAHAGIDGDSVAKLLFTSGSTGMPKGVINTQRMLCSNQQMKQDSWPFLKDEPPVFIDWLPWNHTFGGNHNYGLALYNGGSLYIDDGKPTPDGIDQTVRNLREIAPTMYFNVPSGYEMLLPYLRQDAQLRENYFSRLRMNFYAGAHLAQHVRDSLDALARQSCQCRIMMMTGLGATETAPFALCANWDTQRAGLIGLPVPGVELKLAPVGQKIEARVRGPNVTPGYWRQPAKTAAAFDEEGFYRFGDAVRFVDVEDPQKGLLFDGRIAEDFKLATGTWVSVGPLRAFITQAGAPCVRDVVITGHDRHEVGALVFPHIDACRHLADDLPADASAPDVLSHPAVRSHFRGVLDQLDATATGSAHRVTRLSLLVDPPSADRHEITDKGSINQRAVLDCRHGDVEALYTEPCADAVIRPSAHTASN